MITEQRLPNFMLHFRRIYISVHSLTTYIDYKQITGIDTDKYLHHIPIPGDKT